MQIFLRCANCHKVVYQVEKLHRSVLTAMVSCGSRCAKEYQRPRVLRWLRRLLP